MAEFIAFNKFQYVEASHERFNAANSAFQNGHFGVAHYLCGVSIECLLWSFLLEVRPDNPARHNLRQLMKACGILNRVSEEHQVEVRDAIVNIAIRWSVAHRYAPNSHLKKYFANMTGASKDRALKQNAQDMLLFVDTILKRCT